jgi:hypothetical protein
MTREIEHWTCAPPRDRQNLCQRLSTIFGPSGIVGYVVCDPLGADRENAVLMTAAPKMLAALRRISGHGCDTTPCYECATWAQEAILAATEDPE